MARSQMRHNVKDSAGNVIQNALCYVYETGTVTAVDDMYAASSGGSAITTLTSNAQGDIEAWFDTARTVDIKVTDNSDGAFYPSTPNRELSWTDFTETVAVMASAAALSGHVPRNPTLAGTLVDATNLSGARGIAVAGRYAYVCAYDDDRLTIVDVADPTNPQVVGSLQDATNLNGARWVDVVGRYAYVAVSISAAVTIVDVSDPTTPVMVGTVTGASLGGLHRIKAIGRYAYVTGTSYFSILDVSDPAAPVVVGSVTDATNLDDNFGFEIVGRYAYVSVSATSRFTVIDVATPTAPAVVANLTDAAFTGPHSVSIAGRYAYVTGASADSLAVIDISDPLAPTVAGSVTDATHLNGAHTATVVGRYAYVTCNVADRFTIVDVSDPENPEVVTSLTSASLDDVRGGHIIAGRYAYMPVYGADGFAVVDLDGLTVTSLSVGSIDANLASIDLLDAGRGKFHTSLDVGPRGIRTTGDIEAGGIGRVVFKRKTADETVNNSISVQNDDHLVFAVGVNEVWEVRYVLYYDSGDTADFKVQISGPGGTAVGKFGGSGLRPAADENFGDVIRAVQGFSANLAWSGAGGSVQTWAEVTGLVIGGDTAGNVTLRWAQNTADASDTVLKANSYLIARRVA